MTDVKKKWICGFAAIQLTTIVLCLLGAYGIDSVAFVSEQYCGVADIFICAMKHE
jgi:hypothetical protein